MDSPRNVELSEFLSIFSKGKLRATEVATFLGIHRVTVERFKKKGVNGCEEITKARIIRLLSVVSSALENKELPLEAREITGKAARLHAIKELIRKYVKG